MAHFSRLLCLVEEVEHEYLRSRGGGSFPDCGWPRVLVEVDYSSSAGLGDWLSIELSLGHVGSSSLEWKFAVFHSERPVMQGRYVVVRVGRGSKPQAISEAEKECLISGFSKEGNACK
ncbi:MAG: acyl-CoA thioesterase [Akkermansia sp.]